jgi:chemotaxis protein CheX
VDVFVIAAEGWKRADGFQRFAQEHGGKVQRLAPGVPLPTLEPGGKGVVFFDDGAMDRVSLLARLHEGLRYLGIPLVAVTVNGDPAEWERLHRIGVNLLCPPETPDADILTELETHSATEPIAPELRSQLVEPFISAVSLAFQEWISIEVVVRPVYRKPRHKPFGDIAALIDLKSATEDTLVLSFPERTAAALARRILTGTRAELDEALMRDCLGEAVNIVAGQAKALLAETPHRFVFSTPRVVSGIGQEAEAEQGKDCLIVVFRSEVGDFALQLGLKPATR